MRPPQPEMCGDAPAQNGGTFLISAGFVPHPLNEIRSHFN